MKSFFQFYKIQSIHISTARLILNRPDPVDIRLWIHTGEI